MTTQLKPHSIVIEPAHRRPVVDWRELREYRDLFYFLIDRDIKVLYKQTVLGFGWAILRPVLSMLIFTVIFGGLAQVDSDGVPTPCSATPRWCPGSTSAPRCRPGRSAWSTTPTC